MPETLILHLGLHKTATTALQDFLAGETKALLAHGVAYPRLARMRSDLTPLIASAAKPDRAALARFVDKVRQPVLLLSDENILGAPGDIVGGALYPFAENRVRRFCDQFADRRIRLFLTLRAPAAFLASMYCEYLRHNPGSAFADYARGFDLEGFSYAAVFDWLSSLPRHVAVTVTPFETARGGGVRVITERLLEAACGRRARHRPRPASPRPARGPPTASRSSSSRRRSPSGPTPRPRRSFSTCSTRATAASAPPASTRCRPATAAALEERYGRDLAAFARLPA